MSIKHISIAALALAASACAQTSQTTPMAFHPAGRAAQPSSWPAEGPAAHVRTSGDQHGQAGQPGSWSAPRGADQPRTYASVGVPHGQAEQPAAWLSRGH